MANKELLWFAMDLLPTGFTWCPKHLSPPTIIHGKHSVPWSIQPSMIIWLFKCVSHLTTVNSFPDKASYPTLWCQTQTPFSKPFWCPQLHSLTGPPCSYQPFEFLVEKMCWFFPKASFIHMLTSCNLYNFNLPFSFTVPHLIPTGENIL